MTCADIVAVTKDILVGGSAVGALVVAWCGLTTWRKELYGQDEYQIAKSLLLAGYELRDKIAFARRPVMDLVMCKPGNHLGTLFLHGEFAYLIMAERAEAEIPAVQEKRDQFNALALDAEVLWGHELEAELEAINKLVDQFAFTVPQYKQAMDSRVVANVRDMYLDQVDRSEVFSADEDGKVDLFSHKFAEAVSALRAKLLPKLTSPAKVRPS